MLHMVLESDKLYIKSKDGMSNCDMVHVLMGCRIDENYPYIRIVNVLYENGDISGFQMAFYEAQDVFMKFLAEISLSRRAMFADNDKTIYTTESSDGTTNIDANFIEDICNAIWGEKQNCK